MAITLSSKNVLGSRKFIQYQTSLLCITSFIKEMKIVFAPQTMGTQDEAISHPLASLPFEVKNSDPEQVGGQTPSQYSSSKFFPLALQRVAS